MSEWKAKRFWKETSVTEVEGGFSVLLDGRPVRTPNKSALTLPTVEMAEAVAAEWEAQEGVIEPLSMPVTRSANSAIDKVTPQRADVVSMLAGYAETDLLCHRADFPEGLADLQRKGWDPVLDWAREKHQAPLKVVVGILPAEQPQESLTKFHNLVDGYSAFSLTALHDLIGLSGSIVLGLWVAQGAGDAEAAWNLSRIDEDWQIAQWGEDEEATEMANAKKDQFLHAERFLRLFGGA